MDAIDVKRRRRLDAQAWREVLDRFDGSAMSVHAFCEREGVSASSFHRWRSRLATAPAVQPAPHDEAARAASTTGFIELGSYAGQGASAGRLDLRLDLGGGLTLHLVRG